MPAPKKPNTAAATAAVRRRGQETMAAKLRAAGWTVTPPEQRNADSACEGEVDGICSGGGGLVDSASDASDE